jgi:hypothetical protein
MLEWSAAGDADPSVSRAALQALGDVAARPGPVAGAAVGALVSLLADASKRDIVGSVLAKLPESRIADVGRGLHHSHPSVRRGVVEALGRFQHEQATQRILAAAQDESAEVREAAVLTLARLGSRAVAPLFGELASGDPSKAVRRAAARALARSQV